MDDSFEQLRSQYTREEVLSQFGEDAEYFKEAARQYDENQSEIMQNQTETAVDVEAIN